MEVRHFVLGIVLILCSCSKRGENIVPEETLNFDTINISEFIGSPIQILATDSVLYVNDFYGDTLVHGISLNDGHPIMKFASKGQGPGEIMPPLHLFYRQDSLYLLSRPTWSLYSCPAHALTEQLHKCFILPTETSNLYPADSVFIASGMFHDGFRFAVVDNKGQIISRFGSYPTFWEREKGLSAEVKYMFHQTIACTYSTSHGIVAASSHVLSFYKQIPSGGFSLDKEVLLSPYEYDYREKGISSSANLKNSFLKGTEDMFAYGDYIYLLFNVTPKGEQSKQRNEIWKYSWNGDFICRYHPNVDLFAVTANKEGRVIGLTNSEEPKIAIGPILE